MIGGAPSFNVNRAVGLALPFLTIVAAVLIMPLPLSIRVGSYWLMPSLPIIAIFNWTMDRPDLLPPALLLLAGVFMDLLIRGPIGVSALAFLATYMMVASQRLYWRTLPGPGVFIGFLIVIALVEALTWLATSFAHGELVSPAPAFFEGLVSAIAFPILRPVFEPLKRLAGPAIW